MKSGLKSGSESPKAFYVLSVFSMAYLVIMLFDSIMINRYMGADTLYVLGGTLSSPLLFILDGLITELFRRKMAVFIIIFVFVFQTIFSVLTYLVSAKAPYPSFFHAYKDYDDILGPSLLWANFSGLFAYLAASFCIKVLYTMLLAYPVDRLINKLKSFTGLDPYDKPKSLWVSNRMKGL